MKHLALNVTVLLAALFLLASCGALGTVRGTGDMGAEEREISGFSAVELSGIGNVIVEVGEKETLRIEAEKNLLPYLESEVEDGTLVLSAREGVNVIPTQGIFYYLTVRELQEISVSGLGNVNAQRLEGTETALTVSGSGSIDIEELYAKDLDVQISGLGDLTVGGGEVADQKIEIAGGGAYNASEMASEVTSVSISGLGTANVWARDALDVEINGGGSVNYVGRPQVTQSISGLGEVAPVAGE